MQLRQILKNNNMTAYQLAKISGIKYNSISALCTGKSKMKNCSGETLYKLSTTLDIPISVLLHDEVDVRVPFELFKSNICHRLKEEGDRNFLIQTLSSDEIGELYEKEYLPEALYVLALVDYLSRIHKIPLCTRYDELRNVKFENPIFPSSILALSIVDPEAKSRAIKDSIPEFIRHNIVENEVRNIV